LQEHLQADFLSGKRYCWSIKNNSLPSGERGGLNVSSDPWLCDSCLLKKENWYFKFVTLKFETVKHYLKYPDVRASPSLSLEVVLGVFLTTSERCIKGRGGVLENSADEFSWLSVLSLISFLLFLLFLRIVLRRRNVEVNLFSLRSPNGLAFWKAFGSSLSSSLSSGEFLSSSDSTSWWPGRLLLRIASSPTSACPKARLSWWEEGDWVILTEYISSLYKIDPWKISSELGVYSRSLTVWGTNPEWISFKMVKKWKVNLSLEFL